MKPEVYLVLDGFDFESWDFGLVEGAHELFSEQPEAIRLGSWFLVGFWVYKQFLIKRDIASLSRFVIDVGVNVAYFFGDGLRP